jgi:hypothetical protein
VRWGPVNTPHVLFEERDSGTLTPEAVTESIFKLLDNQKKQNNY